MTTVDITKIVECIQCLRELMLQCEIESHSAKNDCQYMQWDGQRRGLELAIALFTSLVDKEISKGKTNEN